MTESTRPDTHQANSLKNILAIRPSTPWYRRKLFLLVVMLCVGGLALLFFRNSGKTVVPRYTTIPAEIGSLVVKVSATGNLQPTNQVDVGSELSGIVSQVFVDDNAEVKKGQVLARLDLAKLTNTVAKSRASLAQAEAQVLQAEATAAEANATLGRYQQVATLSAGKLPAKSDMDSARASLKRAKANVVSAKASVAQARANLQSDETDLDKASIRSPIDGIVLTREVEPGQTVAASFQAPVLFKLAEDLAKMELQVNVDEADVGQVKMGQKAAFTVDAWPGRQYEAVITRVGYGSQEKNGVISYLTILNVANDDLSLRPGMTGTAEITTQTREKVLLVPNAALRFNPPAVDATAQKSGSSILKALIPHPPSQPPKSKATTKTGTPHVWVLENDQPVAIEVQTGITNGRMTEILGGALQDGTPLITEVKTGAL